MITKSLTAYLGYVWFLEYLGENAREKIERKGRRKIKNVVKINKLFLFTNSNSFYLF